MRTALLATAILLGSAATASAADFRVIAETPEELWFIEPAAIIIDEDGVRRAHIYQAAERGQVLGGRTVRFTDQLFVFDCDAGTYHPEEFVFMDEQFAIIGRAPFPGAKGRRPDPQSTYGRVMAAVCGADDPPPGRTITAANWMDAAARR